MGVELASNILAYHGSADVVAKKTQQDATQGANAGIALRNVQNINKNNVREVKPAENDGRGARTSSNKDKLSKQNRRDGDSVGSSLDITL